MVEGGGRGEREEEEALWKNRVFVLMVEVVLLFVVWHSISKLW